MTGSRVEKITAPGVLSDGTLRGGQIAFPATQIASSDANTLDDYEEGLWTPGLADTSLDDGTTESQTYTNQVGGYTKIGNMVFCQGRLDVNSVGALTVGDVANIVGLPFTSSSTTNMLSAAVFGFGASLALNNASETIAGVLLANTAHVSLRNWDAVTGTSNLLISEFTDGGGFSISFAYRV